ncbi:MAG: polysaccharide pyruvyl transferase family protein [Phycisphaerae bacterium]|jgi:polysaccharide pyruvyl transferase WcaK-like protein
MHSAATNRTNGEYNVCFQGSSLDVGNLGCRALTASFIKLVSDLKPNARINLLYGNRTNGVQSLEVSGKTVNVDIVNFRLSPKARISEHLFWILLLALLHRIIPGGFIRNVIIRSNRWLRTLDKADFVGEIRGGDSFSDIYGLCNFLLGIVPCIIVILMQKELVLLPQTYGPFKSKIARVAARFILLRAHRIFARDKEGIELVRSLLGRRGKDKIIGFCPDIAFVLEATRPKEADIQPELTRNSSVPLIGLNISSLLYIGGFTHNNMFDLKVDYKGFVHLLLRELMEQTTAHVLLIPHEHYSFIVDGQECNEIQICKKERESVEEQHLNRIHVVRQEYNQNETKGIIGLCDFFIGSRMHACIASLSQGIPTVGLAYSKKFRGVFQTVGAEPLAVDMRQKGHEETIETIMRCFNQRGSLAENLKVTIPEIQNEIRNFFREML